MADLLPTLRRCNLRGITALAAVAALASGCDIQSSEIDAKQAEKFVMGAFDTPPRSVDCPEGVKIEKGATFTCDAVDSTGKPYEVVLHMADDEGRVTVDTKDFRPVSDSGSGSG
jgi:hypothetical protein